MSLFADRQLIEIRIPSGKPGKDGSEALQRYCEHARPTTWSRWCSCPSSTASSSSSAWFSALDAAGVTRARRPDRAQALPQWIAQRLARRASACRAARRASARSPSSPTASRATCSPRTRRSQKLGAAAPGRRAELRADRGGGAQRRALRRLQARRGGAGRPGGARAAHARRPAGRGRGGGAGALDAGRGHPRAEARASDAVARRQAAADGAAREPRLGRQGAPVRTRAAAARPTTALAAAGRGRAASATASSRACSHPDWPLDAWDGAAPPGADAVRAARQRRAPRRRRRARVAAARGWRCGA